MELRARRDGGATKRRQPAARPVKKKCMRAFCFHTFWDCFSPFLAPRERSRRRHAHSPRALPRSCSSLTSLLHECTFNFACASRAGLFLSPTSFSCDPVNFDPLGRLFETERDHWRRASRATATCAILSIRPCSVPVYSKTAEKVSKSLHLMVLSCWHGAFQCMRSDTMKVDHSAPKRRDAAWPSIPSDCGRPTPPMRSTFGSVAT